MKRLLLFGEIHLRKLLLFCQTEAALVEVYDEIQYGDKTTAKSEKK